jgi:glycosyltransferase involved in cell wall biosynthesis
LPSLGENFGIAVLEALRSRCPVLVSKNTAWWNLEDNGGGIVFDSTEVDLERAITKFMNLSSGDREKMADYGYAVAQNYNWDIIAKKQDEIYRSLISDFM